MKTPLRVLIVEDSADDEELLLLELRRGPYQIVHRTVQTEPEMRAALAEPWDLILSDYCLPDFSGLAALRVLNSTGLHIPFLIISGTIGEETAVEALRAGAHDFFVKGRLTRLIPAIQRELREASARREKSEAEAALRRSELKYRTIVEVTQEGIWVVGHDLRTTFANRRMAEMLGLESPADLLGALMDDFTDDESRRVLRHCVAMCGDGAHSLHECRFVRRDGTEFWATLSAALVVDDEQGSGALVMVTDVTEHRQLQTQVIVSDRMASMGTLAAGVAHEINNPLSGLIGNLSLSLDDLATLEADGPGSVPVSRLREQLLDARLAADRVRHIVRDLKLLSRGDDEPEPRPVDLRRVVEGALRMCASELRHRGRLMVTHADAPSALATEARLGQVLINLLINAAQAIPEGRFDDHLIEVATGPWQDGRVQISVRDTGAGMSPAVIKRLFTPFFTTKASGVGTGLGLSICHRIVSSFGGEILVDSRPGHGSTFRVLLPAASERPAHAPLTPDPAPVPTVVEQPRRGRVLVVDDDAMVIRALSRTLSRHHEVVAVSTAAEALERLRGGERFDVILCDLMMPEMTGMDLHAELARTHPEATDRMIFLTGGAFTPRAQAFRSEVKNLFVDKPYVPEVLRSAVSARIG